MGKGKTAARYAVKLDATDEAKGYQRVSLVAKPAIQRGWVALSEAPMPAKRVHLSTEPQQQILTGPVLVPDEDILRLNEKKEPYYIYFSAEEIKKISRKLMAEGRTTDTNAEHSISLSGNVVEELWTVVDPKNDKANSLGLDVPAGTLMMSLHIPDTDYWEKEVVSGNKTGFSIEGLFDFEEVQLSAVEAPKPSMKKTLWQRLSAAGRKALGLSEVETKEGKKLDVAEDGTVSEVDADGNITGPAADGEYELADGTKLTVKDGKKAEAVEAAEEGTEGDDKGTDKLADALAIVAAIPADGDAVLVAAELKKALAALGATDLSAAEPEALKLAAEKLFLEAVEMADGSTLSYNPVTRRISDATGKLLETGDYACKDGSCFRVNVEQYTYQISKADYEASQAAAAKATETATELAAEKAKVVELTEQLSKEPAAGRVRLSGEGEAQPKTAAQLRLARAEATR